MCVQHQTKESNSGYYFKTVQVITFHTLLAMSVHSTSDKILTICNAGHTITFWNFRIPLDGIQIHGEYTCTWSKALLQNMDYFISTGNMEFFAMNHMFSISLTIQIFKFFTCFIEFYLGMFNLIYMLRS